MTGHIFIYGGIGLDKREREISAEDVRLQLEDPVNKTASELVIHLISNGGDVFEGEAIYNAIKNTGKKITTHIEGTCASIATLIAAAGSTIVMNKTARFMIHNPKISGMNTSADARDLRHVADQLDQIKTLLINVYDVKTKLGKEKLWELYDNETWLTADEAEKMGFIDESVDAIKAVAKVDLNHFKMTNNLDSLKMRFKNFIGLAKIKNEFTETLQDGTIIVVMSEDEDWTGKPVVYEDGSPLPDGDHTLASGKVISVAGGMISAVKEATAKNTENDDMQNKIKELEAQLAEAQAGRSAAEASLASVQAKAVTAEAKATRFENRATLIEKEFLSLKEEFTKTIGDTSNPPIDTSIRNGSGDKKSDPMGDFASNFYRARNIIS